jgi:hypothetical protein
MRGDRFRAVVFEMTVDEVDGSWRIVADPDLNYEIGVSERDGQAAVSDRSMTPPDAATVEVRCW